MRVNMAIMEIHVTSIVHTTAAVAIRMGLVFIVDIITCMAHIATSHAVLGVSITRAIGGRASV